MWRLRQFKVSIRNMFVFATIVWRHRWWDYGFQMQMIDKMLEECELNWGKNTHHVGDKFTLLRIKSLRRTYKQYIESTDLASEYILERRFLSRYTRMLTRLWD